METLLTNANVLTMATNQTEASQVRIQNGVIVEVGHNLVAGNSVEVADMGGKVVLPAFADCHTHLLYSGCRIIDNAFDACTSIDEMLETLAATVYSVPTVLRGWNLNDSAFTDSRAPKGADLNRISTTMPIVVSRIGNGASLLNQAAFDAIGLDLATPGVEILDRDWSGWVWGEANQRAMDFVTASLTDGELGSAARATAQLALAQGVTTLHAIEGSFTGQGNGNQHRRNAMLDRLRPHLASLPITVVPLDSQLDSPKDLERIARDGGQIAGGDLFLDGVLGAAYVPGMARAALDEPYADGFGGNGDLLLDDVIVHDFLEASARHGISLGVHAVGERSIAQFLNAWKSVLAVHPEARMLRMRIDHGILPRAEDIDRAAELGVIYSMQPVFESRSGGPTGMYARRVGPERVKRTHAFKTLHDAGITLVGGSDSPVNAIEPLAGVRAAVAHSFPENSLELSDAIAMFTSNAAYASFREDDSGSISPGKQADFAVLSHDPRTLEGLSKCQVVETWKAGKVIWKTQIAPNAANM